jgi:membrane-associated phospholipid phosphatase
MPKPVDANFAARAVLIVVGLIAVVTLSYFFADRQLAEVLRPHFAGIRQFVWLTYLAAPLTPVSLVLVSVIVLRGIVRRSLGPIELGILRGACAILIAGVLTYELKDVFGRTWPETWTNNNPSYFGDGVYGFFPFHGGLGYASFPSGHMTVIGALAGTLWFLWAPMRWLGVALALAVAIGLLGADYHWLSDVIAGSFAGVVTAWAAARSFR